MNRRAMLTGVMLAATLGLAGSAAGSRVREGLAIQVAGSGERTWVLRSEATGEFSVLYRTSDTPSHTLYRYHKARGSIIAAAAHDRTVYCVFDDRSVQAMSFAAPTPENLRPLTVRQLPPLRQSGQFIGWTASRSGPWALLRADPPARSENGAASGAAKATTAAAGAEAATTPGIALLRVTAEGWTAEKLPDDLNPARVRLLAMADAQSDRPALLSWGSDGHELLVQTRVGETWQSQRYELKLEARAQVVSVQGNLCVIQPTDARGRRLSVHLLREGRAVSLGTAELDDSVTEWWTAAGVDDVLIIGAGAEKQLSWTRLEITEAVDRAAGMTELKETEVPRPPMNPLSMVVIGAVVLAMLFLFATSRKNPRVNEPKLPKDMQASGAPRVAAALIDLLPGLILGAMLFGFDAVRELVEHWLRFSLEMADLSVSGVVLGVFLLHTTVAELLTGRTLGKALTGCRVVNLQGGPPHLWQVLARNFFKIVELAAQLLLVMPLLGTYHQRLGDLVAGTVVVSPRTKPAADDEAGM